MLTFAICSNVGLDGGYGGGYDGSYGDGYESGFGAGYGGGYGSDFVGGGRASYTVSKTANSQLINDILNVGNHGNHMG